MCIRPDVGPSPVPADSPAWSASSDFSERLRREAGLDDPYADEDCYWDRCGSSDVADMQPRHLPCMDSRIAPCREVLGARASKRRP